MKPDPVQGPSCTEIVAVLHGTSLQMPVSYIDDSTTILVGPLLLSFIIERTKSWRLQPQCQPFILLVHSSLTIMDWFLKIYR